VTSGRRKEGHKKHKQGQTKEPAKNARPKKKVVGRLSSPEILKNAKKRTNVRRGIDQDTAEF